MWSGSINDIPAGWALCDGKNGTPDLRDRFIMGASSDSDIGATGGTNHVTLTVENLPPHSHGSGTLKTDNAGSHTHTGTTNSAGQHTHSGGSSNVERLNARDGGTGPGSYSAVIVAGTAYSPMNPHWTGSPFSISTGSAGAHTHSLNINSAGAHTHTITGSTGSTGSGQPFDNRPAYYKLAFIMKVQDDDSGSQYYSKEQIDSLLDTKVDRAGDTMTGKLIVNSDIEVTGTVNTRNILQDGQKLDRTTASVVPVIKSVKGKNGETATTNSTFTIVIDAESAVQYRVLCQEFNSGWTDNPEITITGLDEKKLYQAVVEVENLVGNRSQMVFSFFRL